MTDEKTEEDISYIVEGLRVLAVPLDSVYQDPSNPMLHPDENLGAIKASLQKFGQRKPIVVNKNGSIIEAGNGTHTAAKALGWKYIAAVFVTDSDMQAVSYGIADNRTAQLSNWDYDTMARLLSKFENPSDIPGVSEAFKSEVLQKVNEAMKEAEGGGPTSDGSLLKLVDVVIGEPEHATEYGDVWFLSTQGDTVHVLCVVDVMEDWAIWREFLDEEDAIFLPYPGPFAPLSKRAAGRRCVLVQPDRYIAGHILDRYAEIYGHEYIKRLQ